MGNKNLKNLEVLNDSLESWYAIKYSIHRSWKNKNLCHGIVMNRIRLTNTIDEHINIITYKNLIKGFVKDYFFKNYFYLTTENVLLYTGEKILDYPFINEIYSLLNNSELTVIKEVFNDMVCFSEYDLEPYILVTWQEVCREIESQTLNLFALSR